MPLYKLENLSPELPADGRYFIAPGAHVIGKVRMGEDSSVWFNAIVRGDTDLIDIGARVNVQDCCVLHTDPGFALTIGADATIGHRVILHGCTIGEGALIGMGATILNGAKIGKNCLVGANALVTEGMVIPDGSLVLGSPAKIRTQLSDAQRLALMHNADHYMGNARNFNAGLQVQE